MTKSTGVQGITEVDIANYLANTPGFFERHAELLGSIQLTSPHGQRAVSLQERQMEMLRDKIRGLEGYGLSVSAQIPIEHAPNEHNEAYLRTKAQRMGHTLHHQGLNLDEQMLRSERPNTQDGGLDERREP